IDAAMHYKWEFDPPTYKQKLTITVTPTGGPVSAWLVKEEDVKAVEKDLEAQKDPPPSRALAHQANKAKAQELTLNAQVPAKTPYALLVKAEKSKVTVKVKIKGR